MKNILLLYERVMNKEKFKLYIYLEDFFEKCL